MKKTLALLFVSLFMTGCISGFEENYVPVSPEHNANRGNLITCSAPMVEKIPANMSEQAVHAAAKQKGYVLIGSAQWTGLEDGDEQYQARIQGEKVGACLVLWQKVASGTRMSMQPLTTYNQGSYSTIKNSDGSTSKVYNSGSSTTVYIPSAETEFEFRGLFYAKLANAPAYDGPITLEIPSRPSYNNQVSTYGAPVVNPPIIYNKQPNYNNNQSSPKVSDLDANFGFPTLDYQKERNTQDGIWVGAIWSKSPLHKAGIITGDTITEVNGVPCNYSRIKYLPLRYGDNIFEVYRNGKSFTTRVRINP